MLSESLIDSKQFKSCKSYPEIVLIGGTFSIDNINDATCKEGHFC